MAANINFKFRFVGLVLLSLPPPIFSYDPPINTSAFSHTPPACKSRILHLMHTGHYKQAFEDYKEHTRQIQQHDFELLQQLCLLLLEEGANSSEKEDQLLTIFGAGICSNEKTLPILIEALNSPFPQLQIVALNFIAAQQSREAEEALKGALASPFALIRLEAVFQLAKKKSPTAVEQAEALMYKLDNQLKPIFPQIFAAAGTPKAMRIFRQLLNDPDEKVRISAIAEATEHNRDDLLMTIRTLSTHLGYAQQEACAFALGSFKDESAKSKLVKLAASQHKHVQLAACWALVQIGCPEYQQFIMQQAKQGDLFAVQLLGDLDDTEELLATLATSENLQLRVNAALALLIKEDPRCIDPLCRDVLLKDARDLAFIAYQSQGKSMEAWRVIPSASHNLAEEPAVLALSDKLRETLLVQIAPLSETKLLEIAQLIFKKEQNAFLIPVLIKILENTRSPECIALLKNHQQKLGAPLVRNYCNLALFRMKIPGPYGENLKRWVAQQQHKDLIRFKEFDPNSLSNLVSSYELSPEDTSKLLVESLETLAQTQEQDAIELILEIIQNGNPHNKYALAGLLMRAIQ